MASCPAIESAGKGSLTHPLAGEEGTERKLMIDQGRPPKGKLLEASRKYPGRPWSSKGSPEHLETAGCKRKGKLQNENRERRQKRTQMENREKASNAKEKKQKPQKPPNQKDSMGRLQPSLKTCLDARWERTQLFSGSCRGGHMKLYHAGKRKSGSRIYTEEMLISRAGILSHSDREFACRWAYKGYVVNEYEMDLTGLNVASFPRKEPGLTIF